MSRPLTWEQHRWRWQVLISTYIGYGGYYLTRKVFTICKTSLATEFDCGLDDIGLLWEVFLIAYMIGQFLNSFLGRKWGPRAILLTGLGVSIACNVVFGVTNSYHTFLAFMFVNGLAQATGWPGVVGSIAQWLRGTERGFFMGVWSTSYVVGNMVVKALGGYLLGVYGWQWSFLGCTFLTLGVWVLLFLFQRNRPEDVGLNPILSARTVDDRAVRTSEADRISFREYLSSAFNPVVLVMGASYFSIKFLRYALDSWLPTFLEYEGLGKASASYYSGIFDMAGLGGAVVAGILLDWVFRGNWARLCFFMALGMIAGYVAVLAAGSSPVAVAWCFGLVGFMLYGPDTLLCGAASVEVAGEKNAVAVVGIVNGIASLGPVIQEEVIRRLMGGDAQTGIRNANIMYLTLSVFFACMMLVMMWRLRRTHRGHAEQDGAA